jgi:hypothetical protein
MSDSFRTPDPDVIWRLKYKADEGLGWSEEDRQQFREAVQDWIMMYVRLNNPTRRKYFERMRDQYLGKEGRCRTTRTDGVGSARRNINTRLGNW